MTPRPAQPPPIRLPPIPSCRESALDFTAVAFARRREM